jgi:hypothetical protein
MVNIEKAFAKNLGDSTSMVKNPNTCDPYCLKELEHCRNVILPLPTVWA